MYGRDTAVPVPSLRNDQPVRAGSEPALVCSSPHQPRHRLPTSRAATWRHG